VPPSARPAGRSPPPSSACCPTAGRGCGARTSCCFPRDGNGLPVVVEVELSVKWARRLEVVELAGGALADAVMVRAYLLRWADYAAFNAAYEPWFPDRLPSRTCVGTTGLAAGALVEVDLVCWRTDGWAGEPQGERGRG
jgi:2-iminobutanoate/2-iminopropanoate deaminase